jgi:TIR domain-containing protein
MRIFLLSPGMTVGGAAAADFHRALAEALSGFLDVVPLADRFALAAAEPRKTDAAVLYNRADGTYAPQVAAFLDELVQMGGEAYPVALTEDALRPPASVSSAQSFDVPARLRQRGLPAASVVALAPVFAREIIARQRPTLVAGRVSLFVSYRRADGEPVAAAMAEQLRVRAQAEAFRDRVDVRAGEDAQQVILERLSASDAVIFVDTPRAGESEWVLTELRTALGLQLPVLWVRFGPDEHRIRLAVEPSGKPHLVFPEVPLDASRIPADMADRVLDADASPVTVKDTVNVRVLPPPAVHADTGSVLPAPAAAETARGAKPGPSDTAKQQPRASHP